jgi:serine/threonine protein kinase
MTFSVGDTVGAYRILEELGRGGMGRVFKVEHTITRRLEAMKVLEGGRAGVPEQGARSLREIQLQASLDHPNIAAVHNAFWAGEDLVLVMELIEGCSLRRLLEGGRTPLEAAISYGCQALDALSYAHAHGVIHRDVSPSNMMVGSTGVLKLTDFGLSKRPADLRLSQTGAPVGSLYYMSPEQVQGEAPADERSDIYSLGAVLYELVTGKRAFDGESAFAIMTGHVRKPPASPVGLDPSLPQAVNDAILRSLAKDPAERFRSADEFRQALVGTEHSQIILPTTSPQPFFPRSWIIGTAAALAVVALAMTGFYIAHNWIGRVNKPRAAVMELAIPMPAPPSAPELMPSPQPQATRPMPAIVKTPFFPLVPLAASTIPNLELPPTEPPIVQALESVQAHPAPPPRPTEEPAAAEVAGVKPAQPQPEVEADPKPGVNLVKRNLGRIWRLVRRRKSSPVDTESLQSPEKP